MLIVRPGAVSFGGSVLEGVASVAIERTASRELEEWQDSGRYCVLADVPEERVRLKLVQEVDGHLLDGLKPGDEGTLVIEAARHGSDSGRVRVTVTGVVMDVRYAVPSRVSRPVGGVSGGASRSVEVLAVSADGVTDPVVVERL